MSASNFIHTPAGGLFVVQFIEYQRRERRRRRCRRKMAVHGGSLSAAMARFGKLMPGVVIEGVRRAA